MSLQISFRQIFWSGRKDSNPRLQPWKDCVVIIEHTNLIMIIKKILLDQYYEKSLKIDFIKMDIQGSEHNAFKCMKKILSSDSNIMIFTEFSPKMM